ncbi:portal protein [Nitratireductor rhodophyticola]|uniref:portal protein n=1 Tax=Nitratireductor rhodophyticola TaxID=2854036 RepID=UPI00300ABA94
MTENTVQAQKRRADRAWEENSAWDRFYRDAYDYVIPQRRPGGSGTRKDLADKIYDMTGPTSAMNMAGELQNRLFSGAPILETGALAHQAIGDAGKEKLDRELEKVGSFIYPFMQAGEFDTATHEMCIDLGVGTGVLIPMRGTPEQPIIFYAPPADEIAVKGDAWGRQSLISWKRMAAREEIRDAFPQGNFSKDFIEASKSRPNDELTLYQDFFRLPDGRWQFAAYLDKDCEDFISQETYRTKPIAVAPYYRVPGEMRGRGPVLLALPSIKTLNKAQEMALRSAAIQMLGIWAYRAGGTFNPDTVRIGAGQFWPMQSTGGILGPDVQRMDPATGRLDVSRLVIEGMQDQVREALFDTRLPPSNGTPKSASEIAALIRQNARVHLNGFQRLWRSIHPVIVPRCAEILHSFGYLRGMMSFNELMVSVSVRSPITAQMNADMLANLANYIELLVTFVGPQKLDEHLIMDPAADKIAEALSIPKGLIPDSNARQQIRADKAEQMAQQAAAAMAEKAAPQLVEKGLELVDGGRQAA